MQSGVHEGSLESTKAVWSPGRQSGVQEGSLESTKAVWSPGRQSESMKAVWVHEGSLESMNAVWSPWMQFGDKVPAVCGGKDLYYSLMGSTRRGIITGPRPIT